ncbi:MAG TPA: OsmC family protein [Burkholderiaceae bacterium]|jgi:organic hydroperoxide reductase OsmC/OhrA|nr:OsmC family protein [Burkholderiaceae bacterium]
MTDTIRFAVALQQVADYEFRVRFDLPKAAELTVDEPEPLGQGAGPNAARLIGAAVANCLSSSLLFCIRKFRQNPGTLHADVTGHLIRNPQGRMRIGGFDVTIRLGEPADAIARLDRCAEQFEDFCVVTESVRHGIPVAVRVVDSRGQQVYAAGTPFAAASGADAVVHAP